MQTTGCGLHFFVKKLEDTGCVFDFQGVWECKLQGVVYISQHSEITIPKNAGHCFWVKIMKTSRSDGFSNKKCPQKGSILFNCGLFKIFIRCFIDFVGFYIKVHFYTAHILADFERTLHSRNLFVIRVVSRNYDFLPLHILRFGLGCF